MLKKHEGIIIPETDPFSNDKLNRKAIIENLTRLITNLHQPFVISINSPWGTGKTVFIKMWEQYLKNENFATLYFNAWENDFSSEPLISLLSEIKDQLVKGNDNDALKTTANNLLKKGRKILKHSLPFVLKVLIETIFNL
ncbi:MAG TPA: P-loop NTPase fold protein, partial [Candidatus Kapabacteria bacterium]|nr:P-loop NTPase fold protein [Candidatus Kapabacteria bacterium]